MKKLYSVLASAALVLTATAANQATLAGIAQTTATRIAPKSIQLKSAEPLRLAAPTKAKAAAKAPSFSTNADFTAKYTWGCKNLLNGNAPDENIEITVTDEATGAAEITGLPQGYKLKCTVDAAAGTVTIPNNQNLGADSNGDINYFYIKSANSDGTIADGIADQAATVGNIADGVITFPRMDIWAIGDYNQEHLGWWVLTYVNTFTWKDPDAKDYSVKVSLTAESCVEAGGKLRFTVKSGADVASAKCMLIDGFYDIAMADYFTGYMNIDLPATSGSFQLPTSSLVTESSLQTLFVGGFDADGNAQGTGGAVAFVFADDADNWTSIGQADFTEDLVSSVYKNGTSATYKVEVLENKETKGLYRVMNPYAENHTGITNYHTCDGHFLLIDATDPEKVLLKESVVGFEGDDGPEVYVSMNEYSGQDDEAYRGKLDNGVITFPKKAILNYTLTNANPYYACSGAFKLVLPDAGGIDGVAADADADAPVEYFNLQGMRVAAPAAGQLVIRRQGDAVSKILVK